MRVVIIEDESIIRKGIINKINWESLGAVLIGEAANGAEGLEVLERTPADLVLVDIRMPIMDGPTFISMASASYPHLQFIVISGFNDFEYARQAIRYGVKEYLLKPVDAEELNSQLQKLITIKKQHDQQQAYIYRLQRHYDHEQEELRALHLTRLLMEVGETTAVEASHVIQELMNEPPTALIVFEVELRSLPFRSFRVGDESLIWYCIRNIVEEYMANEQIVGVTFRHAAHASHFVVIQQRGGDHWVKEAIEALEHTLQVKATAAIGLLAVHHGELSRAYDEVAERIKDKLLYGSGRVFRCSASPLPRALLTVEQERMLGTCLLHGRKDELRRELERVIFGWFDMSGATFRLVMKGCEELEQIYRYYASEVERPQNMAYWAVSSYEDDGLKELGLHPDSREVSTRMELLEELYARGCKVMEIRAHRGHKTGKSIVAEVKEYIDQHYYVDISLNWVAEHYYIHAKYFARLFKEKVGEGFTEYIMRTRLERACELLENGTYTVREIAGLIGYEDPSYFSIVFRKHTGFTPTQYRESRNNQVEK